MRVVTALLLVACAGGAYHWWSGRSHDTRIAAIAAGGFVPVEMPDGAPRNAVLILAPPNCPSEQARRAESLASDLARQGIPVTRGSSMAFNITNPTDAQHEGVDRAVAVFNAGAPAVFVNGMGMSNPTTAQAVAAYRKSRL